MPHPNRKYGRLPDDLSRPKLDLTHIVAEADFSVVPATADYISPLKGTWQMLGNDVAGDCVAVRWANARLLMGAGYPSQAEVWELYRTQNPGFNPGGDPSTNGPGSVADNGMSTDAVLAHLHTEGGPDGVKVLTYGTIDPANEEAVKRAIAIFGAVWVDILVQPGNQDEFSQGKPWTNTGEAPEGGHAVLGGGYTPERLIETWADVTELDESFWNGEVGGNKLVTRVYLPIWPEHATKEFIASEGAAAMAEAFKALTGRDLVWPNSPPAPAGDPSSFRVTDLETSLHVRRLAARAGKDPDTWLTQHLQHYFRR